ncbi:MAG: hypothetical protein II625_02520 [Bacilli bacterium]|nr:hypothetical protein [Bacilli bacterium]
MEVANSDLGMNYNNTNSDVNTSSSIDSSATGAAVQSSTNTSAYQTNNTGNTYEVEEIDLSAEPEEEGFFESAGKAVDSGLEKAGAAISNGISAIGNFFAGIGKAIYDTGAKVVSGVKSWVSDRIEDLKGIGKSLSETAANVANNVSSLLGRFGNWVTGTALPAVGNALKKTGASIGNVVTGLVQGVGQFGEALVDTCAIVGTAVGSIVTGIADFGQWVAGKITGNENWHSITKDMWADTMEFVKTEHVNEAFKKFHENSPLGKWLDENAYAPFKSDGAGYKIANGVGYIAGIIALTIATMGIGTAVSGGAAAASGATAAASSNVIHIGSLATIGITKQAVISGTIAATAGFGKNTEHAWNDGAGLLEGMGYGAAKGLWEGGEMFLGASINSLKLANLGHGAIVQQLATTGTHVALDTIDGASASFIDPLMQMIYNPNETNMEQIMQFVNFDENGNRIADKSWDELSFTEKYDALFKFNGGWTSVMTNAGSAAAMSFLSEIPDIRKAVNGTNAIETIAAATTAGAATKEIVGSMGDEAGKETSAEVGKAIAGTASESAETAVKTLDVPKSEIDLYLEKYMMDPDVTPPMGIPQEILDFLKKAETDPDITIPTGMPKEIVDFIQNKSAVTDIAAGTGTSSAVADATTSTAKSIDTGESVEAVAKTFGGEIKYSQEEVEEYLEKFLLDPTTELPPGMKEALDDYVGVSMAAPPAKSITAVADEADAAAKEIAGAEAAGATVISTEEAVSAAKEIETEVDSATKAAVSEVSEATDGASEAAVKSIDTAATPKKIVQMTEDEIHASIKSEIAQLDPSAADYAQKLALLQEKEALEIELAKRMSGVVDTGAATKSMDLLSPTEQAGAATKAKQIYDAASAKEPQVRSMMESMTGDGATLAGVQHDIKSIDSIQEKIARLMQKGYSLDEAAAEVNDSLRYTFILDSASYGSDVLDRVAFMKSQGYEVLYVNNSWGNPTYQGLNITFRGADGSLMEVQFHTQASYSVKEGLNHELYEISRNTSVDSATKDVANRIQQINQSLHGETVDFAPSTASQIDKAVTAKMMTIIDVGSMSYGDDAVEAARMANPGATTFKDFDEYKAATAADEAVWRQRIKGAKYVDPLTGAEYTYEQLIRGYIGENADTPGCYYVLNSVNRAWGDTAAETLEHLYLRDAAGNIMTDAQGRRAIVFYGAFGSKHVYYHDLLTDELIAEESWDAIRVNGRNITYSELLTKVSEETKAINDAISMNPGSSSMIIGRGTGWNALEKYGITSADSAEEIAAKLTKYGSEPIYMDDGFMSSTPEMGGGFMDDSGVNLIMTTKDGSPVGNFSYYNSSEQEVLIAAGSKFRVTGVKKSASGQGVYIYLTQE